MTPLPSAQAARDAGPALPMDRAIWPADVPAVQAARVPDRAALIFNGRITSFANLDRDASAFVSVLRAAGLKPGDRVAYLGKNDDVYFTVIFGCMRAGMVLVPVNWRNTAPELRYVLEDSGTELIIAGREFAATIEAADAASRPQVIFADDDGPDGLIAQIAAAEPAARVAVDPDAACLQMYTSGTTGKPKGVLVSQRAIAAAREMEMQSIDFADWQDDDVILSPMPNFHMGGMSWVLCALWHGLPTVITAAADPGSLLDLCLAHGVTRTFIVPTVVRAILEELRVRQMKLPQLRGIHYGASSMDVPLLRASMSEIGCRFLQYYGMTEMTGSATILGPRDHDPMRPHLLRSVGKALPGFEIEIRNRDGAVCASGEAGEIWLKSPSTMIGYWNKPEATAEALRDGWYRTGDGGFLDAEGYLFLTDRIKDMIVSGGENVYPVEVEAVLREHPAILDAAVFGLPDERWGELVAAAVELRPGKTVEAAALIAFARQSLAGYKIPRQIDIGVTLPRTASGKVQRGAIRARIMDDILKQGRKP